MATLRSLSQGKLEAYKIDPREIVIRDNWNFRDTTTPEAVKHIAWLKSSIAERGVDEPIWIENDGDTLYLIAGECRLKALQQLWDEGNEVYVPTFSYKGDEAAVLAKSLVENTGLPPTMLEFGRAAERLQAFGWTVERIAALTPPHLGLNGSKAKRFVREAVELQQAPLAVKEAIAKGVDGVSVTPALALKVTRENRIQAKEIIDEAAKEAKAKGKTVARRPKGEGVVAQAKQKAVECEDKLLKAGDKMASLILADGANWTDTQKAAKQWQSLRS